MVDWKQVLGALNEGIVVTRPSSEIVWANDAYCALTGYRLDELIGRTPALLRSPHTATADVEQLWDMLRMVGRAATRFINRRADGSLFPAELSFARLDAGDDTLFVCSMRDVSIESDLEQHLKNALAQAENGRDITIMSLASLAEQRDRATGAHLNRIEAYVRILAEWQLARTPELFPAWARDAATVARCSVLHDIGKVGIPDSILLKAGPLTPDEQAVMKQHPRLGADILDRVLAHQPDSAFLRVARDIVACHHETWDGRGYPDGLAGDAIPLVAQLTTVADVFDALTSRRPYKPAHHFDEAMAYVRDQSGTRLSPLAVTAFLSNLPAIRDVYDRLGDPPTVGPIAPSGLALAPRAPELAAPVAPPPVPARSNLATALREAVQDASGGELIVRSGSTIGRVLVWQGRIAWITLSTSAETLAEELTREAGLSADDIAIVVADCKRSGKDFAKALLDWRLVPHADLERILRGFLSRRLDLLFALAQSSALFVPVIRSFDGAFTFALPDLLPRPARDLG
jgi:PAS domain S-box-containing protein